MVKIHEEIVDLNNNHFYYKGLWTLMTAVGRKSFEIYVDELKKMVK